MIRKLIALACAAALSACVTPTLPPKADAVALHRLIEAQTAFKTAQQVALACHAAAAPPCVRNWSAIADINDRGVAYEGVAVTAAHAGNSADIVALTVNFQSLVSQLSALGVPTR